MLTVKVYSDDKSAVPERKSGRAAGYDIYAPHDIWLPHGTYTIVDTGLVIDPTELFDQVSREAHCMASMVNDHYPQPVLTGLVTKVFIRSSVGIKQNVQLMNGTGIIDADYVGPLDTFKLALKRGPRLVRTVSIDRETYDKAWADPFAPEFEYMVEEGTFPYTRMSGALVNRDVKHRNGRVFYTNPHSVQPPAPEWICKKGDRIAQLTIEPVFTPVLEYAGVLRNNTNGSRGGIGSTGK